MMLNLKVASRNGTPHGALSAIKLRRCTGFRYNPWMSRLKTLVLAAALLVMPLQGIAASLSDLLCDGEAQMHAMHASSGPDRGTHQDSNHNQDAGGTSGNSVYHPCHNTVSAPLVVTFLAAVPAFPVRAFVPDTLYGLFVPEQPQRPPLA
jgi:hypothetical protein